jgi:hypothetical protein
MHAETIVKRMLTNCLSSLHEKQAEAVHAGVVAALEGGSLSLSRLAQRVPGEVALRHRVKRMDRLLGNDAIHGKRLEVYGRLAEDWLSGIGLLLVVVDWSDVTADQQWHVLRASVAVEGRSVTLYEEVHPRCHLGNRRVQQCFLEKLARLIPVGCQPILLTDAGFRSPWFDAVEQRHWSWIGRIRNRDQVCVKGGPWQPAKDLYALATGEAREIRVLHVRTRPTPRRMVLIKKPPKGRIQRTRFGSRCRSKRSRQIAKRQKEPWLLACSPNLAHLSPTAIVALYTQRMTIEESFRDTKNSQLGQGLSESRSRSAQRFEMLLMIGHLACWLLRLIGESAQQKQMTLLFQSTCRTQRKEISVITLARRTLLYNLQWLSFPILRKALLHLRWQTLQPFLFS